jgi:hypothetical protein
MEFIDDKQALIINISTGPKFFNLVCQGAAGGIIPHEAGGGHFMWKAGKPQIVLVDILVNP